MSSSIALTDSFLETLRHHQAPVSIFLMNGIKLHGVIEHFDDEVILLHNTLTQLIFKHAISTVVPNHVLK